MIDGGRPPNVDPVCPHLVALSVSALEFVKILTEIDMNSSLALVLLSATLIGASMAACSSGSGSVSNTSAVDGGANNVDASSLLDGGANSLDALAICSDRLLGVEALTKPGVYRLDEISLGDADRAGVRSDRAWQQYGFNLDGLCTTSRSKDACLPPAGGPPVADGRLLGYVGVDNSFGANWLAIASSFTGSDGPTAAARKGSNDVLVEAGGKEAWFSTLTTDVLRCRMHRSWTWAARAT